MKGFIERIRSEGTEIIFDKLVRIMKAPPDETGMTNWFLEKEARDVKTEFLAAFVVLADDTKPEIQYPYTFCTLTSVPSEKLSQYGLGRKEIRKRILNLTVPERVKKGEQARIAKLGKEEATQITNTFWLNSLLNLDPVIAITFGRRMDDNRLQTIIYHPFSMTTEPALEIAKSLIRSSK